MSKAKVFISYASDADKKWLAEFSQLLEERGVDVWFDEARIQLGESIADAFEEGLRNSDTMVYIITPESIKSASLYFELGAALGMKKRVVAIVSRDMDLSNLPQPFRMRKFLWQQSPEETANAFLSEPSGKAA